MSLEQLTKTGGLKFVVMSESDFKFYSFRYFKPGE